MRKLIVVHLILTLLLTVYSVSSAAPASRNLPLGFLLYCLRNVSECPSGGPKVVTLTPALRATIERVQWQVNAAIRPRPETRDLWQTNPLYGDCDDYVMTKRQRLLRAGVPASAMSFRLFKVRTENHVTLLVHTTGGTFELDNLRPKVRILG